MANDRDLFLTGWTDKKESDDLERLTQGQAEVSRHSRRAARIFFQR